jgi:hypothetical protein
MAESMKLKNVVGEFPWALLRYLLIRPFCTQLPGNEASYVTAPEAYNHHVRPENRPKCQDDNFEAQMVWTK